MNIILLIVLFLKTFMVASSYDLSIIGRCYFADGLGRLSIALIDSLKDDISINFIPSSDNAIDCKDIPENVIRILEEPSNIQGNVTLVIDAPWHTAYDVSKKMISSNIKISYCMLEASEIPLQWVNSLNNNFDAVVVPDQCLVEVYKNCGVLIPIFVIPCPLYLGKFLDQPLKNSTNKVFTFGSSAAFGIEKNHEILLRAFMQKFKNNENFQLNIHGRWGGSDKVLKEIICEEKIHNVSIMNQILSHQEYIDFFKSLDCYVLLSRGEGFSITPREALALGIPCILSNNTAHKTICSEGFAIPVKSNIQVPIFYSCFGVSCGYQLNCLISDAAEALEEVYTNYFAYLAKSSKSREWAKQYNYTNLKTMFLNIIKPKNIVLGEKNNITKDFLMTNSKKLYKKYKNIGRNEKK